MKLQTKITLYFAISISFVFSIAILLVAARILSSNQDLTTRLNTQLIEAKASEAGSWLSQRIGELRIISKTDVVKNMDPQLKDFVNRLNDDLSPAYGNEYGTFAIGGLDGLGYVTDEQTIDISQRGYFIEAMSTDEEYVLSTPVSSKTDQTAIVLICYPVYNGNGEKAGFINGAVSLNKLTDITDGIQFYNGTSLILDSQGNVYTNTEGKLKDSLLANAVSHVPAGGSNAAQLYTTEDEKDSYMLFYVAVPGAHDWYLCTIVNRGDVFSDTWLLLYSIITIWAILMVIIFVVSYLISRTVTRPIKNLSDAMEEVQKGSLNRQLFNGGKDEVSQLAKNFDQMVVDIKNLIEDNTNEQQEKYLLKLQVLQSQIKPHFLYNTLDTLHWKALEYDAYEMAELINDLSSFFRTSLSKEGEFIRLADEVEHARSYLAIQQFRYQDILTYTLTCPQAMNEYPVPKFIIQPLVENAIYHGIKPALRLGEIHVKVWEEEALIFILIQDTGVGMSEDVLERTRWGMRHSNEGNSYGLYNVNQRIQLLYGDAYGLKIESAIGKGTTVTIRLAKNKVNLKEM